ncbi:MAG: LuxR family transcriptional regulator fused with ATPase domain [Aeromicrobium sp.]|nr:LuxR family transcriptional regulator fused with ATPase domain [Aeromicrobium sp.]
MGTATSDRTAHSELLGRADERYQLTELIHNARQGHGGAAMVLGEAGIGKSALLEDLIDQAHDWITCRAVGVESEMELAYAGLQQLCGPMVDRLTELPELHRSALERVFGLSTGPPPDRYLVGIAVLDLLVVVARQQPVLWMIDDAHWLDRSSLQSIGFVSRRLRDDRIAIVIAARDTTEDGDLAGLREIRLGGLNASDAGKLLDSVVPGPIDRPVRDRIIAETRGNPLALLELPRTWTTAELVEGLAESGSASLTGHLEVAFAARVAEFPLDTKTLLTLAAAEPTGDAVLLWSAADRLGLDWKAAVPAECAGLVEFGQRVRFRHPLVRAVAYRAAPTIKRLEVHRALAEVTDPDRDPDRRAWHRANSTATHDEGIAVELEESAGRAKARGGLLAASALLERAARLTPPGPRRADRTLTAAKAKREAGALDAALGLLADVESNEPSELLGALAEQLRGRIAFDQRRGEDAAVLLMSAAQRLEPIDPNLARDTHLEALAAAVWASGANGRGLIHKAAEAARSAPLADESARTADLILDGLATRVTEGYEAAAPKLTKALARARNDASGADDSEYLSWLVGNRAAGILATETWDYATGRALAERQVAVARDSGALVQLQFALNFLANNVVLTGDTQAVAALVEEERLISTLTGVTSVGYSSLLLDAFRGDSATALPAISETIKTATNDGQGRIVAFANYVSAVLYNGLGRHAEALECARRLAEWDALGYQTLAAGELAEAASRESDTALLAEVSSWLRTRAAATPTEWALGILARVQALEAGDAEIAGALYRESIEHLERTPLKVELARSRLLHGEWLRRKGQRGDARVQILAAHSAFTDMGIGAFAHRAQRELSATTWRRAGRSVDAPTVQLTSQELQITQLIEQGLTNREIGGRLFLSARTVEWHLRNIFGKVGVTSRRQLRDKNLGLRGAIDGASESGHR